MVRIKEFRKLGIFPLVFTLSMASAAGVYAQENTGHIENMSTEAASQSALGEVISQAVTVDASLYTPESLDALNQAVEQGNALLNDPSSTEEDLQACLILIQGILTEGLVPQTDKSALGDAISQAESYTDSTDAGYEELQSAIASAKAVYSDDNATVTESDAQIQSLSVAMAGVGSVDKSVLNDLISQAEALDTSSSDPASVSQLQTAIASAKQVSKASSSTQAMVDKHIQLLEAAAAALYGKTESDVVYDGTYEISGSLRHATANQVSMGNDALVKPFQLIKKGNKLILRIECKALTARLGKTDFTGYISKMWYFPGMTDENVVPYTADEDGAAVALQAQEPQEIPSTADMTQAASDIPQENPQDTQAQEEISQDTSIENAGQTEDTSMDSDASGSPSQESTDIQDDSRLPDNEISGNTEISQTETDTASETSEEPESPAPEESEAESSDTEELFVDAAAENSTDTDVATQEITQEEIPQLARASASAVSVTVESWYDKYDSYNDPKTGTDDNVKGQKYPHYITLPVQLNQSLVWTQLYVPVMEAISTGGGKQYAKMYLDWTTLKQISGTQSDKSALKNKITSARKVLAALQKDSQGYAKEQLSMLTQSIATGRAVYYNMNVDQTIVDKETQYLTTAVNAVSKTAVNSDKSQLKKAIATADTYLNETEVDYAQASLDALKTARSNAKKVYDNEEATQTEVNKCVSAIDTAIQGLVIDGSDRRALGKTLKKARARLKETDSYPASAIQALQTVYDRAHSVYSTKGASQEEVDAQNGVITYVLSNMKKIGDTAPDRTSLHQMLLTASNMAGREELYTDASIKTLNKAIKTAQAVYDKTDSAQKQLDAQVSALSKAIRALVKDNSTDNNSGNNGNNDNGNNNNENNDSNTDNDQSLDINNLKDGIYSVTGKMVKTDKSTASMSDEAINHTIRLTVKDGSISVTLDFKGLTINGQQGYLGTLKYFQEGYTTDSNNSPQGNVADVTVESVQQDSSGAVICDSLGSNYPDVVTFPLIKEAKNDGFVPLQVFVPIMDSISKGTGTQSVYLKLDFSTLKKTTADDESFTKDDSTGNSSGDNTSSTGGNTTLGTNSTLGGNSSLKTGGSSLGGNSSLSTSGSTTSLKSSKSGSLSSGISISGTQKGSGDTKATTLKSSAAGLSSKTGLSAADTGTEDTTSSTEETTAFQSEDTSEKKSASPKVMVPMSMSAIAAAAGILYKLKNRPRKKK